MVFIAFCSRSVIVPLLSPVLSQAVLLTKFCHLICPKIIPKSDCVNVFFQTYFPGADSADKEYFKNGGISVVHHGNMKLAFSTSWIDGDPTRIESVLPHIDSIEIGTRGDRQFFREILRLLRKFEIPVTSIHASCGPHKTDPEPYYTPHFMSKDNTLRQYDREQVARSAQWAEKIGARALVLHAGGLDDAELKSMYRLYKDSMLREGPSSGLAKMKRDIMRIRGELMNGYLSSVIAGLRSLCLRYPGVIFCLETRVHYYEVPLVEEAGYILDRLKLPNIGYWHDVGHTFILDRLGFTPQESWQRRLKQWCIGTHLHDVDVQLNDHLPPGLGSMDFGEVLGQFEWESMHTLEIHPRHPLECVLNGIERLRRYSTSG
jgi:sugar phosphate isomerase/epimerase